MIYSYQLTLFKCSKEQQGGIDPTATLPAKEARFT